MRPAPPASGFCLLLCLCLAACGATVPAADPGPRLRLNQVGYYPGQPISVTLGGAAGAEFFNPTPATPPTLLITDRATDRTVAEAPLLKQDWAALSGQPAYLARLDSLPAGEYRATVAGTDLGADFRVAPHALRDALRGSVKGLYYQRASRPLDRAHAGPWHRPAGHPDTSARFHPSSGRTSGTLSSPGGWYDAGDFNKYVVNGAFPLAQLLTAYEAFGDPAPDGTLNIPESGNGRSDYLDELRTEMDWLLTMQDPADGGCYHKLTTLRFAGMVMPHAATAPRYVVGKGVTGTLDFAGAAAQFSRLYRPLDAAYADRLLTAARRAFDWAQAHPATFFRNPADVSTGEYGDDDATAEFAFAAAELFATTGEQRYLNYLQQHPFRPRFAGASGWRAFMGNMAAFTLLRHPDRTPEELTGPLRQRILSVADSLVDVIGRTAYRQPLTTLNWGSNSDVLNAAYFLTAAYREAPRRPYLNAIHACVDYVLGHNPVDKCYLTGFGTNRVLNIHHRQSAADGIPEPVPGLLSGGPNSKQQDTGDGATYEPGAAPLRSWTDQTASYASNEICLNWNAPLTYVLAFLEAR